ncbi:hypothetical protein POV27_04715 [Aureisphaera galaxeae]|uniref:hypothetical protein n=1 Tax=Aureisphaera galaxeae TaxID=1538023 RepID=UPI0023504685|nr:hypothetical protein [Aureisphaera galaxeae]MDC8003339.1 hypothetical protein [Aureisphaera galaxeae]
MKAAFLLTFSLLLLHIGHAQEANNNNKPTIVKVPFSTVEISPVYPGCKGSTNEAIKKCTQESIRSFLLAHFNQELLKHRNKRLGIHFLITSSGAITDISATIPHKYLEEEIIRIVSLLPNMEPGERRGEKVGVLYGTILDYSEREKS